jgi:uncharacterized protein YjgD (DUF1641 family)
MKDNREELTPILKNLMAFLNNHPLSDEEYNLAKSVERVLFAYRITEDEQ